MSTPSANATTAPRSPAFMRLEEPDRRFVHDVHLVRHARTGVDQQDQIERRLGRLEELDDCCDAVFEDREVAGRKSFHELSGAVGDGDVERHEVGAAAEDGGVAGRRRGGRDVLRAAPRRKPAAARTAANQQERQGRKDCERVSRLPPGRAAAASRVPGAIQEKRRGRRGQRYATCDADLTHSSCG